MASFVIHHTAGLNFLKQLEEKYHVVLTEEQKKQFLLGNLIVDSTSLKFAIPDGVSQEELKLMKKDFSRKVQEEKVSTHFRTSEDKDLCIQVPIVEKFVDKYDELIKSDMSALGYLFHLYTDKQFFCDLFDKSFECLDENMKQTIYIKLLKFIKTKKNGNIYLANEVFSKDSKVNIYDDYTVMNKIILSYYNIEFPFLDLCEYIDEFINPGIEEVDYNNIFEVLRKTKCYIEQSYSIESDKLNIFDVNEVKKFIPELVDSFIGIYSDIIDETIDNINKKTKIKKFN